MIVSDSNVTVVKQDARELVTTAIEEVINSLTPGYDYVLLEKMIKGLSDEGEISPVTSAILTGQLKVVRNQILEDVSNEIIEKIISVVDRSDQSR